MRSRMDNKRREKWQLKTKKLAKLFSNIKFEGRNSNCRLCKQEEETTDHLISGFAQASM
jgi:uncharacterized protein YdeI (YjbR/CyaY-like superfamily)